MIGQFFLPCFVFGVCYYFSDLVCDDVSDEFVCGISCFLILSSHFVSIFNFEKEWFSDGALCMSSVKVLISESICVLLFKCGCMLILLQSLVYFFQSVCFVD